MAVTQLAVKEIGCANAKRSVECVTVGVAGIGMQCKIEFQGYSQSGVGLIEYGTAGEPVGYIGACPDVLAILIVTLILAVNAVRGTGKTGVVTGTHIVTWSGYFKPVAHFGRCTSAKTDRIGTDSSVHVTVVVKADHSLRALAFLEMECTQINPGSAAHLLIDFECGRAAGMEYYVSGVVNTG